jgi:hypothetical protein
MRRKLIKILLFLLLLLLVFFGLFSAWAWYQTVVGQALQAGEAQAGLVLGGLVVAETAVLYGVLAGFFLLVAIVSIWVIYRLVMFPPEEENE